MSKTLLDQLYFRTLAEVSGERFDYIVIGAGAYGTSFAHKALALDPRCRVLLLEKGSFLIPEHIQNLPPTYIDLNQQAGTTPWAYTGTEKFMPQIPYAGGRALFWNAWVPQPPRLEMPDWPEASVESLTDQWLAAGRYLGRRYSLEAPGNANASLGAVMRERLFDGLDTIRNAIPAGNPASLDSAMATAQGGAGGEWSKFAPIAVLVADVQADAARLAVVSEAEVLRLARSGDRIVGIETTQGQLAVNDAQVILACNTLEAAFIVQRSAVGLPLVGKNLCGHIRSWLALRMPATEVPGCSDGLQVCAFYLPGQAADGRLLHTHITVAHNPTPALSYDVLYKVLPDASMAQTLTTYQDPAYVVVMLHTMGEFLGERSASSWNYAGVNDSGQAVVHVVMRPGDHAFWGEMDRTTFDVGRVLAGEAAVQYQQTDGSWLAEPPPSIRNSGLVHEAGTFWMGEDPAGSVTDINGTVHGLVNLHGVGSMLFPRPGSFNPTLTGIAQSFGLAQRLAGAR
ncbi:GMC family oxidoreductase (plasmid) [Cupriavidus sp. P-10]|uniref:GMC oxidoreductase n=1 Tax=Cupriavidus sp. P-10 TaxID=2027911 RepID=UPI000E2FA55A|nr:GMC oxidoreductase [Cupriavidus sp. P-10]BDB28868.1 GMC family oxidoreductase [Cupriavidus sp. P-10]